VLAFWCAAQRDRTARRLTLWLAIKVPPTINLNVAKKIVADPFDLLMFSFWPDIFHRQPRSFQQTVFAQTPNNRLWCFDAKIEML
jgi:hypothetical protein